ncbi:hypothetical protein OY671_010943, partial [Metschnikowia pulcherrima]
ARQGRGVDGRCQGQSGLVQHAGRVRAPGAGPHLPDRQAVHRPDGIGEHHAGRFHPHRRPRGGRADRAQGGRGNRPAQVPEHRGPQPDGGRHEAAGDRPRPGDPAAHPAAGRGHGGAEPHRHREVDQDDPPHPRFGRVGAADRAHDAGHHGAVGPHHRAERRRGAGERRP